MGNAFLTLLLSVSGPLILGQLWMLKTLINDRSPKNTTVFRILLYLEELLGCFKFHERFDILWCCHVVWFFWSPWICLRGQEIFSFRWIKVNWRSVKITLLFSILIVKPSPSPLPVSPFSFLISIAKTSSVLLPSLFFLLWYLTHVCCFSLYSLSPFYCLTKLSQKEKKK